MKKISQIILQKYGCPVQKTCLQIKQVKILQWCFIQQVALYRKSKEIGNKQEINIGNKYLKTAEK